MISQLAYWRTYIQEGILSVTINLPASTVLSPIVNDTQQVKDLLKLFNESVLLLIV